MASIPPTSVSSSSSSSSSSLSYALILPSGSCPTLTDLCLQYYCRHLDDLRNLHLLPEPIVQQMLYLIYIEGGLTPSLIRIFDESGHESIQHWIKQNIHLDRLMFINSTPNCRGGRG